MMREPWYSPEATYCWKAHEQMGWATSPPSIFSLGCFPPSKDRKPSSQQLIVSSRSTVASRLQLSPVFHYTAASSRSNHWYLLSLILLL